MFIDHAMLINLKRREDKFYYALGRLSVLGFEISLSDNQEADRIIRFIAHDGLDYPDCTSICKEAFADGFNEFSYGFDGFQERTRLAWCWTWRCALRRIVEMKDKTVLLLIDDHLPTWNWTLERFSALIDAAKHYDDPNHGFRLIQLYHVIRGNETRSIMKPPPRSTILEKGLSGIGDVSTILTAEGAKLLLDITAQPPYADPDTDFAKLLRLQDKHEYHWGVWHTIDNAVDANHNWESDLNY